MRRTTIVARGDFIGFLSDRPIAIFVFLLIILALIFPFVQAHFAKRRRQQIVSKAKSGAT